MSPLRSRTSLAPLAGLALALVGLLPTRGAAADPNPPIEEICGRKSTAFQNLYSPLAVLAERRVPIDARPWFFGRCERPTEAVECVLESEADALAVGIHGIEEACVAQERDHLLHLLPERPLLPDTTYTLKCAGSPISAAWFDGSDVPRPLDMLRLATKESAAASLPPPDLAFVHAHLRRRDDTCCGDDPLYLEVEYPSDPEIDAFLADGGSLEVLYDGDLWLVVAGSLNHLPWGEGGVVVTAVAADGVRGPRLVIPAEEIDEERILIPCRIAASGGGFALWLLAPLLGLRLATRRRRRAATRGAQEGRR
ncbi:MAG: hypothetical protein KC420_21070, partial [Myxococcales bacterium]|nr:hypothetical protein [Myxococcales bacterium]MCB9703449.1 hypothetical protein [Myxococcales bacterium]